MNWKNIFKTKIHFKKWMILLITTILLITSMNAALFATVETDTQMDIYDELDALQFMAADWNHEGERVLQREGNRLVLNLGVWPVGESKTYPAAFAIVNPSEKTFNINNIELKGEPDNLRMYLHQNMDKPCSDDLVNVDNTEEEKDMELLYDPQEVDPIHPEWELGPGDGYDNGNLKYGSSGEATKEDGVWTREMGGPKEAEEGANFVWVEMAVDGREAPDPDIHRGPIEFEIDGEFEPDPEPNIAFMGSGRRDGAPMIERLEGNTIRLSATDLKEDTTVVVPDAFAIVNAGPTPLEITDIVVEGDTEGYMQVWLHGDPHAPAGDYDLGVDRDEEGIQYYPTEPGESWQLGEGFGFDENENLLYGQTEDTTTAQRTAGRPEEDYYLWMYDEDANNVAEQGTSNFVWVEVAYIMEGVDDVESTITFNFSDQ